MHVEFKKQTTTKKKTQAKVERERQTKKQTFNYREQTDGYKRGVGGEWVK